VAGARSGGDDEGGGEDERAAGAGAGAEALAEQEDAEQRTDEGLHVEQDAGLGCGDLGDSPVPEQGGGCGAEQAAGGEGEPDLQGDDCDGRRAEGLTIEERDDEEEHRGAGGDSVAVTVTGLWRCIRRLLMRIQARAMTRERTTSRSPARVGPVGSRGWRAAVP